MKKLSLFFMMATLVVAGMISCNDTKGEAEQAIALKIQKNEALTQEDYSKMIDYLGEFAQKAEPYVVGEGPQASEGLKQLETQYPFANEFNECIKNTPIDKFNDSNKKKINKFAGLVMFSAPGDDTINTDPKAAGIEVATPDSANGVIAGAEDNVEVKN